MNGTEKGLVKRKRSKENAALKAKDCRVGKKKKISMSNARERSWKIKHWKIVTGFYNKITDDLGDGKLVKD